MRPEDRNVQVARLALALVGLASCHVALPLGTSPSDGPPGDKQLDLIHGLDGAPRLDGAGPVMDLPAPAEAARPAEAGPPDGPLSDQPTVQPDGPTGPLCGGGKPAFTTYSDPKMILCADFTGVTYCNAAPLCPAGWAICDSVQYIARGGAVEKPGLAHAWITGCVKKDNAVFPPDPNPCAATCVSANDPSPPTVIWNCDTNAGGSVSSQYLGIIAVDTCHRIGSKQPTTAAFWIAFAWDAKAQGALCCAP